jgi:hypothetical protein
MISLPEAARCFPFTAVAPEDAPLSAIRCHPQPERHDCDYNPFGEWESDSVHHAAPETRRET